jgi:hypothetical protein
VREEGDPGADFVRGAEGGLGAAVVGWTWGVRSVRSVSFESSWNGGLHVSGDEVPSRRMERARLKEDVPVRERPAPMTWSSVPGLGVEAS